MSGKNNVRVNIRLSEYDKSYHMQDECSGKFEILLAKNFVYTESVLGPIQLDLAPVIVCKKCEAEFLSPKFPEWVDREIAKKLIMSKGNLNKKQIKFLRLDFNFTQEELGKRIGLRKEQIAKMENSKYSESMSADKQFRLKFHLAKILRVDDLSKLQEKPEDKEVDTSKLVPSKRDIRKAFAPKNAA